MRRAFGILGASESSISIGILLLMSALPILEAAGRELWGHGIPGSVVLVQHLTLWLTFAGAALAAGSGRLLTLATPGLLSERMRGWTNIVTSGVAVAIVVCLLRASFNIVLVDYEVGRA